MAFKINNPFTNKDERSGSQFESFMPQSYKDERAAFNIQMDERLGEIKQLEENFVKRRGTGAYRETMEKKKRDSQPLFTDSKKRNLEGDEKKYPYLMSVYNLKPIGGHNDSRVPWECHPDPTDPSNFRSQTCIDWHQNEFNRQYSLRGRPRGILKDMEWDARLSHDIMEAALALDYTEENYVKNLRNLANKIKDEKGGWRTSSVVPMHLKAIDRLIADHEEAVAAQDSADNKRIMNWELQQSMDSLDDMFNEDGSLKAFDNIL